MIYVDNPKKYPNKRRLWCHMMTDSDNLSELHNMALRIGLRKAWFQDHPVHPHYDLTETKRNLAIALGACPVSDIELVKRCSKFNIGS